MTEQRFSSVWDAIADTPQETLNLKLRSRLMDMLVQRIEAKGWTQTQAAAQLGVTQPRISDLHQGKLSQFSLDKLVNMLAASGQQIDVVMREAA